jgi:hypothetical protein
MQDDPEKIAAVAETEVERLREALKTILGQGNNGSWADVVEPLVARFEVAAKFGADAVHNGTGAGAIAELLRSMAEKLDTACDRARTALNNGGDSDPTG